MNKILLSFGIATAVFFTGCGGSKPPETAKEESAAPAAAPTAADDANAATLTGKVSFSGEKPAMRNIDMSANPACARAHAGAPPKSEEVVVNGDGTLKNVFVWVKSGVPDRQWPVPSTPVELAQKGCMYGPHVIGVMAKQNIKIINGDPTNHNIHPLPKINQEWNESQPPKGEAKTEELRARRSHDPGEVQRAPLDALLYRRGEPSVLRRDRRRRYVYHQRSAPWKVHGGSLA